MPGKSSLERTLLAEQLSHYRLQRHDFLNHWQVIMGYIQLGKAEQALHYMQEGVSSLEVEQQIGQIPHEIVAATLLGFVIALRKEDLLAELLLDNRFKQEDFWREVWQEEYGEVLYGYTKECEEAILGRYRGLEEPVVEVKLDYEGMPVFKYSLLDGEQVVWENSLKL